MGHPSLLHKTNIIIHILAGSIALILGIIALIARKGGKSHRKSGDLFLLLLIVVIGTGLVGVFIFGRNGPPSSSIALSALYYWSLPTISSAI